MRNLEFTASFLQKKVSRNLTFSLLVFDVFPSHFLTVYSKKLCPLITTVKAMLTI